MDVQFVSVFVEDDPFRSGNPLAVCHGGDDVSKAQMQAIAQTLGLSESSFVTRVSADSYEVRIFTPTQELPFAGHPTIGTAWVLRRQGLLSEDEVEQTSRAGLTRISFRKGEIWMQRPGSAGGDLEERNPGAPRAVAEALGLEVDQIGLEARELGRPGHLRPAFADAGLEQLMVPVRDLEALAAARPNPDRLDALTTRGAYVFTATGAGTLRARGFFGPVGVGEDPATGSAAAGLGLLLADRLGPISFEIKQGVEIGRPCRIAVKAEGPKVEVGGRCGPLLSGVLEPA